MEGLHPNSAALKSRGGRIRRHSDLTWFYRARSVADCFVMPQTNDTIAALATPVGTAALALVRISGSDTLRLATELAGRPPLPRTAHHVDYRDRTGALIDDVVLTYFAEPRSYTGEDAAEVSCHGNPFIAQKILEDLFARGCRPADPGEFTHRAFLNGRMDLSQAEAVMDVIHARSERALAAAHDQLRGSIGRHMQKLVDDLLAVLAKVEAYIDFPDEDLPAEDRAGLMAELGRLQNATDRLLATSHYGEILRDGIKTVIVGEPNVGKSSLLNQLVGRERALVSSEPGTTRDFIEERIIVGPHCVRLIDTAGLNPAPGALEKLGMERTVERLEEADLILVVLDGTAASPPLLAEIKPHLRTGNHVILFNKSDLANFHLDASVSGRDAILSISAQTGEGLEELRARISKLADAWQGQIGADKVAVNARHANALREARIGLKQAQEKLLHGSPTELLASDLRVVLEAYGQITGKVDNERMLDHLFATFCIGK